VKATQCQPGGPPPTECPVQLTVCPGGTTQCDVIPTVCQPIMGNTICPVVETQCDNNLPNTLCPSLPTTCPACGLAGSKMTKAPTYRAVELVGATNVPTYTTRAPKRG